MSRVELLLLLLAGTCVALAAGCAAPEVKVPERVNVPTPMTTISARRARGN